MHLLRNPSNEYVLLDFVTGKSSAWHDSIALAVQHRNNSDTSSWGCGHMDHDEITEYVISGGYTVLFAGTDAIEDHPELFI